MVHYRSYNGLARKPHYWKFSSNIITTNYLSVSWCEISGEEASSSHLFKSIFNIIVRLCTNYKCSATLKTLKNTAVKVILIYSSLRANKLSRQLVKEKSFQK
jgi:hypothetical protein